MMAMHEGPLRYDLAGFGEAPMGDAELEQRIAVFRRALERLRAEPAEAARISMIAGDTPAPRPAAGIRVIILEPAALVREGLVALLSREEDMEVVAAIGKTAQLIPLVRSLRPDVAIIGNIPGKHDAYKLVPLVRQSAPECRSIIMAAERSLSNLRKAVAVNVAGYLVSDSQTDFLVDAVRKVAAGRMAVDPELALAALDGMASPLTSREADALRMVAKGFTTAEIADGLCLTVGTVRNYLSRAIAKTGARNRGDAIRIARESAWL